MAVPEDLRALLDAGSHFGHQSRRWNPKMDEYIYAVRDGVHVFDLTKTADLLNKACEYIEKVVAEGKVVVLVGTKRQARDVIREEAARVGAAFVAERWLGGAITNWDEISKRVKKLKDMKQKREAGEYGKYTKREQVLIDREIDRLERFFGGISMLERTPDVLFVVDTNKEKAAVKEAAMRDIPVVAIVDSNSDPDLVAYPIPANDDAVRSIKYIVSRIADAYGRGKARRTKSTKGTTSTRSTKGEDGTAEKSKGLKAQKLKS